MKKLDLTGRVFHKLTVLGEAGVSKAGNITWHCKCACGNEIIVAGGDLTRPRSTKSCGCIRFTHRQTGSLLYHVWGAMLTRCANPVKNYGARGISVCPEWSNFAVFRKWALSNGYTVGLTLDRQENDNGYSPENCRWVTSAVQNRNKRTNYLILFHGSMTCAVDVAAAIGLHPTTLTRRLKRGWPLSKALNPADHRGKYPRK